MKITEKASDAILHIMKKQDLDPNVFSLSFCNADQGLAFQFVKDDIGNISMFNGLKVITAYDTDLENLTIDLQEVNGKTGLIFIGE